MYIDYPLVWISSLCGCYLFAFSYFCFDLSKRNKSCRLPHPVYPVEVRTSLLPVHVWRTSTCQPSLSVLDEVLALIILTTWITGWPRTPTLANPVCGVWVTCTAVLTTSLTKELLGAPFAPGTPLLYKKLVTVFGANSNQPTRRL